ncbi:hypothetical protein [Rheinheimera sp.]|uniref:hypothetical protein n=1 Tax=Rheinheimera sp. TaxID=1869214 RepID=UPI00307E8E3A
MSQYNTAPGSQTQGGDQTIKQVAQWMQKQQNRIDEELKEATSKLVALDKTTALTDQKVSEISTSLTSFKQDTKTDLKELRDSISSLKTTIAWAGGAVAMLGFVIGLAIALLRFIPK